MKSNCILSLLFISFFVLYQISFVSTDCNYIRIGSHDNEDLRSPSLKSPPQNPHACETCADKSVCCDGEFCCGTNTSTYCCGVGSLCCNGTCCNGTTESCCGDPINDGVCCLEETTFCCPAIPDIGVPSRCCPRWTVCCTEGEYGCCFPESGTPLQTQTAYGLYEGAFGGFYSMVIDMNAATYTTQQVNGFNDWGETPRVWTYNGDQTVFHLLQANFTVNGEEHVIYLYTVDPVTGKTSKRLIQGAVEEGEQDVLGFEYVHSLEAIVFSVEVLNGNQLTGYNFYQLDITNAQATLVSSYTNVTGDNQYMGWFDTISVDGTKLYRIGYRDLANSVGYGVGITDISQNPAVTTWRYDVPMPNSITNYVSINSFGDGFISLGLDANSNINIVQWDFVDGKSTILSDLPDGNFPPYFGPVVEYMNTDQTVYGTLVVYNSYYSNIDRWAMTITTLPNGTTTENTLSPWILAKVSQVAALGFS